MCPPQPSRDIGCTDTTTQPTSHRQQAGIGLNLPKSADNSKIVEFKVQISSDFVLLILISLISYACLLHISLVAIVGSYRWITIAYGNSS